MVLVVTIPSADASVISARIQSINVAGYRTHCTSMTDKPARERKIVRIPLQNCEIKARGKDKMAVLLCDEGSDRSCVSTEVHHDGTISFTQHAEKPIVEATPNVRPDFKHTPANRIALRSSA